jgi:hypothetical protein
MMETMEVLGVDPQDEVESESKPSENPTPTASNSGSKVNLASRNPIYPAIMPAPQASVPGNHPSAHPGPEIPSSVHPHSPTTPQSPGTPSSIERPQKKKKALTPEQREKLEEIQREQETVRKERVATLSEKLLQKISVWLETDRGQNVTEAFKKKMQVGTFSATSNSPVRS